MVEIHAIAVDQLAKKISEWNVYTVIDNIFLGKIIHLNNDFVTTDVFGFSRTHKSFYNARDSFSSEVLN